MVEVDSNTDQRKHERVRITHLLPNSVRKGKETEKLIFCCLKRRIRRKKTLQGKLRKKFFITRGPHSRNNGPCRKKIIITDISETRHLVLMCCCCCCCCLIKVLCFHPMKDGRSKSTIASKEDRRNQKRK